MARNYKQESAAHKEPKYLKENAARKRARYKMEKAGKVSKGDGKEVDHLNMNPNHNAMSNLKVTSKTVNRKKQPRTK